MSDPVQIKGPELVLEDFEVTAPADAPMREEESALSGENGNPAAVPMDLHPGDCVVWHGNSW